LFLSFQEQNKNLLLVLVFDQPNLELVINSFLAFHILLHWTFLKKDKKKKKKRCDGIFDYAAVENEIRD
jgi:hypothetical protein